MAKFAQTAGFQALSHRFASCHTHRIVTESDDIEFSTLPRLKRVKKKSDIAICNPTV